jgi:hypothetical protein
MNDGSIGDMFMDILGSVNNGRLDGFSLNDRLNRFMNMMVCQVVTINTSLDGGAFRRENSLLVLDSGVHFLVTRYVFVSHLVFMMTMFGCELFVFMFCRESLCFLHWLDSVLMMVNFVFASDILVDLLRLGGSDGFVSCFRFNFRMDGGIVVFTGG